MFSCLLVFLTAIVAINSKPLEMNYDHLIKAPGLEDQLVTHHFEQILPYIMYVERITYCSDKMSSRKYDTFLIGGSEQEKDIFPEFECEKINDDEVFSQCALCFRTHGEAMDPVYLLDMRFTHDSSDIPESEFYVWSHPKNLLKFPWFNEEQ